MVQNTEAAIACGRLVHVEFNHGSQVGSFSPAARNPVVGDPVVHVGIHKRLAGFPDIKMRIVLAETVVTIGWA